MMTKKLPVGIESFEEIRKQDFYYVDKTDLISDLLANWGKVNLFTRPRRFGKTLLIDDGNHSPRIQNLYKFTSHSFSSPTDTADAPA